MKSILLFAALVCGTQFSQALDRPPSPEPGKCYTKVKVPAKYRNFREKVIDRAESFRTETLPAQYATKSKEIVVEEAKETFVTQPATYKTVQERVLVSPEKRIVDPIPAKFEVVRKKVQVQPERFGWVKGEGPQQKIDGKTGDILCYKKLPAVYKTVSERVMVSEASVSERIIPAKYKTVSRKVVDRPSKVIRKFKPAVKKMTKVKELVRPAEQRRVVVPATYKTISRREVVESSREEWRSILCQTNATPKRVTEVQQRLAKAGFFKGPATGYLGPITARAVASFQESRGLATGGITDETLSSLGLPTL